MMGWTSYHASYYKNGKIDRKAECDDIFNDDMVTWGDDHKVIGKYEVLKSAMVGSTYYAAVKRTKFATETEPEQSRIFAVICLTSTNMKEYYNFSYKDMDESCGPGDCDCPKSILDLLPPTDNEWANEWRKACYENIAKKKNPNALNKLPWGSIIEWTTQYDLTSGRKAGDKIKLTKCAIEGNGIRTKIYWSDGYYRIPTKLITSYTVIKRGEA